MGYHYKYKEYIYRHMYPKKSSALFTYHRHPDGRGGFLDDGICELCGTRGRTVLIENEFGEIGIDGGFLKDAGIEITEMNSGCICCTLVGDFSKAL